MKDKRSVLITGGTGSIGRSLVATFAKRGYEVTFQYLANAEEASKLEREYGAHGLRADLSHGVKSELEVADILINNAGVNLTSSFAHEITDSDWDVTLGLNVTAVFQLCRMFIPHMMAQKWGRIINISSIYGLRCVEQNLPYNVSKHAMRGLTGSLAREYALKGITVNEICPGSVESDMMIRVATREAMPGQSVEAYLDEVRRDVPAGRMATAGDVAAIALFLASDEASYINGISIPVDGGYLA